MPTEKMTFKGHAGDVLAARFDLPDGPMVATAVFAHCFTCSKDIPAAKRISQRLAAMGFGVLRFDFTGLGHSEGEFSNTHFTSNVDDIVLAAKHLADTKFAPKLLIGHSLGGAAVLRAAARINGIKAIATIGAPSDPAHVSANFKEHIDKVQSEGAAEVTLAGRSFTIRKSFLDDIATAELLPDVANLNAALMVLHSPVDQTVGVQNASEIFLAAKHPKSFVSLDNADHLISSPADADFVAGVIAAWAQRYLRLVNPAAPIGTPEGIVRTSEADAEGFLQDITAGPKHHTNADEPKSMGGTERGMTPYQFLSAGLGACTSMTIRMYARRKKWPLHHVSVDVTHDRVHASDCEHCESSDMKIDTFNRRITLTGTLEPAQRDRLLEIADRCPVHRTLEANAVIKTELA